jgi:hypothetical protein
MGFVGINPSHAQDESGNYFLNGGFEDGVLDPWGVYGGATAEVVSELVGVAINQDPIEGDLCLHVTVPAAGANWWEVGLVPSGAVFEQGKKYTVSAFLKCKEGTFQVDFKPQKAADPWTGYGQETFTITEEWAEYSVTTPVFAENVTPAGVTFHIGFAAGEFWIDGVRFYEGDYVEPDLGLPELASRPNPEDGAYHEDTWITLSWTPGAYAVSHDVYLGEDFDVVNDATRDSEEFRGNQGADFYIAGFPGYAYPEGLVPGTTYYWRIDEVNDADPNSPWKGDVWSFTIPPKKAYNPNPADGTGLTDTTVTLSWTAGFGAKMHTVYFGDDYDEVNNATVGIPRGTTFYDPGELEREKVNYWRVDEFDGFDTFKGDIWTFTTPGAIGNPQPANGATDMGMATILSWTAADNAASHQVYLGLDKDNVRNADTNSIEYKGSKALGSESYDPGLLDLGTTYYWRVDEVYNGTTVKGPVWSFTVGDFLMVDDFESYTDNDAEGEAIWQHWIDGFGIPGNGAQVGYLLPPYAEQTIVHGSDQSMPLLYFNEAGVTNSEAVLTLTAPRDWTVAGVGELSLWIHGDAGNAADPLYVAISNATGAPAIVAHDEPDVATDTLWTQWQVSLQAFADQGINLTDLDKIAIGLGSKGGAAVGGIGTMYIDDIRLYRVEP